MIKKVHRYSFPVLIKLNFLGCFSKNTQISNFMIIHAVGAKLLHANRRTDRHEEADSRFPQFCVIVHHVSGVHKVGKRIPSLLDKCLNSHVSSDPDFGIALISAGDVCSLSARV